MVEPEGKPVKFTATIKSLPLALNQEDGIDFIGSVKLFMDMLEAGWIKPIVQKTRFVLYSRASLEAAFARVEAGEYPGAPISGH
jgi:hypothetical protein